jgi:hypothetical protein
MRSAISFFWASDRTFSIALTVINGMSSPLGRLEEEKRRAV